MKKYLIFHLCSSSRKKELSYKFWAELYEKCRERDYLVYFTGQGDWERTFIGQVVQDSQFNLCGQLKWMEFVRLIQLSCGVVSVDSVPVHLAACFNIPCAVLFVGTEFPKLWHPNIASSTAFGVDSPIEVKHIMDLIQKWIGCEDI